MTSILNHYLQWMKAWPKSAGPKVTEQEITAVHQLGARAGSKATLAAAMYSRKDGATQSQIVQVVSGPQLNVIRRLVDAGQAERVPMPKNEQGHTVYRIKLIKGSPKKVVKEKATGKSAKGGQKDGEKTVHAKPRKGRTIKAPTKTPATPPAAQVDGAKQEQPQGDGKPAAG